MATAGQALKQGIALQKAGRLLGAAQVYSRLLKSDWPRSIEELEERRKR